MCDKCDEPWSELRELVQNRRSTARQNHHFSDLLMNLIDSLVNETYPLIQRYADALEAVELSITLEMPKANHVRKSYLIRSRLQVR